VGAERHAEGCGFLAHAVGVHLEPRTIQDEGWRLDVEDESRK
jgi:hypothetical protein